MTLPTHDAQPSQFLSPHTLPAPAAHSNPSGFPLPTTPVQSSDRLPKMDTAGAQPSAAADFSHSWDLATGGFKTLTAKRELPPRQQRRILDTPPPEPASTRSYMFLLVVLACIVVMLISGGVVLFMMLQS